MSQAVTRFAHLHQHTDYSLLDGAARIKDLVAWVKAVSPDHPAVAMTDHGNMHGAIEFYKVASAAGVKPIIGLEAYVAPGSRFDKRRASARLDGGYYHLTLLAKDFKGYQNLCRLSSRSYLEGFYMKPRVDLELLAEHSDGIIALSGCLGGQIPRAILDLGEQEGERLLNEHLRIFGSNFFIEIQDHGLQEQKLLNPVLRTLADKYGLGMVATNDGHYVKREDARAHDVLLAIQTKTLESDPDRMRFPCDEFYVKSPEEMAQAVSASDYPGALENSMAVAELCNLELPIGDRRVYQMPEIVLPAGLSLAEQIRVDAYRGLIRCYPEVDEALLRSYLAAAQATPETKDAAALPSGASVQDAELDEVLLALARAGEAGRQGRAFKPTPVAESEVNGAADNTGYRFDTYVHPHLDRLAAELRAADKSAANLGEQRSRTILERVEYELGLVIAMGFADYFLIVADYINWAKGRGIAVGPGRGSGAGSIVAFALGITNIDPLAFDLLFERFLNPERVSMPDFDIDFSDTRRGEVIEYVREKYGDDKVTLIATFGTLASKAAIRDAARVLEVPYADSDAVSKLIPVVMGRSVPIDQALAEVSELKALYDAGASSYVDMARALEGLTRHASVHAAGVVIARQPVQELAPVFRSSDGHIVCQYDMGSIEELGLLKMDFLGLRTLSFIEAAVRIVRESRGITLEPDSFALDDPAVFELLSRGDAAGVFQFESPGMIDTLRRLKPRRIQDLINVSALYRPGPMKNIPSFIKRHHGLEEIDYSDFPKSEHLLSPILAETYGIPVYQEQVMQIVRAVAGFSLGQADIMRRAMGKKKKEEMAKQRVIFQDGAEKGGIDRRESGLIFDLLERFADYGFPKGHAAAYGVLSYQTAYLKAHFPVEFTAALLSVERGDSDKVAQYITDARRLGIDVLPPDINESRADFTPVEGLIRFGLYGIKNVGDAAVEHILKERDRSGPFVDLFDFCKRIDLSLVNKRAVEHLIKAGAFDRLSPSDAESGIYGRAVMLDNLDRAMRWGNEQREQASRGQAGLFGDALASAPELLKPVPEAARSAGAPGVAGDGGEIGRGQPDRGLAKLELLRFEKEALGLYISAHPMASYPGLSEAASCVMAEVEGYYKSRANGGRVKAVLTGLIQGVKKKPTLRGGMMARFDLADESGSRELVVFNKRYEEIAQLLAEDRPAVVVAEVSEDGDSIRLVVERLIRWDLREAPNGAKSGAGALPEVALLSLDLADVGRHHLLELRSLLDERSGMTPVMLAIAAPEGRLLYRVDNVRLDRSRLDELRSSFPWLGAELTIDRAALLAERSFAPGQRQAAAQPEVPF